MEVAMMIVLQERTLGLIFRRRVMILLRETGGDQARFNGLDGENGPVDQGLQVRGGAGAVAGRRRKVRDLQRRMPPCSWRWNRPTTTDKIGDESMAESSGTSTRRRGGRSDRNVGRACAVASALTSAFASGDDQKAMERTVV